MLDRHVVGPRGSLAPALGAARVHALVRAPRRGRPPRRPARAGARGLSAASPSGHVRPALPSCAVSGDPPPAPDAVEATAEAVTCLCQFASAGGRAGRRDEGLDRHDGERASARLPAARRAARGARRRGRDHGARLRADAPADRAARDDGDARSATTAGARGSGKARQLTSRLGALRRWAQGPRLRRRARARLARADDHGAPARDPELDHLRLRVGLAAAPARLPGGDEGRRPGLDPGRAARPLRRRAAEAPPVPGAEGGVLPLRLRARPDGARRAGRSTRRARSSCSGRRPTSRSTTGTRTRSSRRRSSTSAGSRRARGRAPADRGAARLRALARAAVGDRPRRRPSTRRA